MLNIRFLFGPNFSVEIFLIFPVDSFARRATLCVWNDHRVF